jgi:hypothetical protein
MRSSILAGHRADLRLSCLFPNRCQALMKHSQIHHRTVNGKLPGTGGYPPMDLAVNPSARRKEGDFFNLAVG